MGAVALCTRGSEVAVGGGGRGESIPPHPCADWGTLRRSDLRKPPRNESREVAPLTLGTPTSTPPPPRAGSSGLVVSSDPCAPALKGSLGVSRVARQSASALLAPPLRRVDACRRHRACAEPSKRGGAGRGGGGVTLASCTGAAAPHPITHPLEVRLSGLECRARARAELRPFCGVRSCQGTQARVTVGVFGRRATTTAPHPLSHPL